MTLEPYDACGKGIRIVGNTDDPQNFPTSPSGRMMLRLVGGSEHFFCSDCVKRLPGGRESTVEDVAALQAPISRPCRCRDRIPERWIWAYPRTPLTMNLSRIIGLFPAPGFRGAQEQALRDIRDAFVDDNDVVLVRTSTGSGKSPLVRTIAGSAATVNETSPAQAVDAYYMTSQVSQLDDVIEDDLLSNLRITRGKSNYNCITHGEEDTPADHAFCVRRRGSDYSVRHHYPHFSDHAIASNRQVAAMTPAYFIQTVGSDVFRKCDMVVVDEAYELAEQAEMYATIGLKPWTVPVWDSIDVPDVTAADDPVERASRFVETSVGVYKHEKDELLTKSKLVPEEAARRDRLQELIGELGRFVEDYRGPQSPMTWVVDQRDGKGSPITIKPLDPAKYLKHTVRGRGDGFAFLSVTTPNGAAFYHSVGLDSSKIALVNVEHTFPVESRPLYDVTQGKMVREHRDEMLPKIARLVVRLMAKHPDEKGSIHRHLYAIQAELRHRLAEVGLGNRVRGHDRDDRSTELETWEVTDRPEVFLSVKMEEALDLNGDFCCWQVLYKAPHPNMSDSRVARRLEDGQWAWYRHTAL